MAIVLRSNVTSIAHNASISIALPQKRAEAFFLHCRGLSTRPPLQRPEVAYVVVQDDAHLPFVDLSNSSHGRRREDLNHRADGSKENPAERLQTTDSDDWHAEVQIVPEYRAALPEPSATALTDPKGAIKNIGFLESGSPREPGPSASEHVAAPVLPHGATAHVLKSRAQSRSERKRRRIEAGSYRAQAAVRDAQGQSGRSRIETVLAKIAKLDGEKVSGNVTPVSPSDDEPNAKTLDKPFKDVKTVPQVTEKLRKLGRETWQTQKEALEHKFGDAGWQPRKRLSPDTLDGIRALHASDPTAYSTATLSEHFKVTPEAIRRILKSKWRPSEAEADDRRSRWERRGAKKWQAMAEQGMRAPAKWRAMGAGGEEGLKEERMPRRIKDRKSNHLSWDDVVGGMGERVNPHKQPLAERFL
ncbi:hypothetical protein BAUCODRAFT_35328 [Baudoinia panamericana UAMH 10762]|uniref:Required for respiratory growth protein 9, mitochondrial n=1 Tax=Baudoinia panamericana (strain UAMH 10762) TaxID=717646 RepID=M2N8B9_BAUPA|nr:uncharacterized protein BAUCODRAFT_35328 [Baudoinia panamericana UAMH 10762]EMC95344.1 hypothetical protein BAUCODRAFT_35328 [Baudoinia panamericana UAMH 10762]